MHYLPRPRHGWSKSKTKTLHGEWLLGSHTFVNVAAGRIRIACKNGQRLIRRSVVWAFTVRFNWCSSNRDRRKIRIEYPLQWSFFGRLFSAGTTAKMYAGEKKPFVKCVNHTHQNTFICFHWPHSQKKYCVNCLLLLNIYLNLRMFLLMSIVAVNRAQNARTANCLHEHSK